MTQDYTAKIEKKNLTHGEYYVGECRNAGVARWNAFEECFYYWREKFGTRFIETIKHPDDDDTYDVFVVEAVCTDLKEFIPFKDTK